MFKSDRCGIETEEIKQAIPPAYTFKSDRCGIETKEIIHALEREYGSNQTVAGLKRNIVPEKIGF